MLDAAGLWCGNPWAPEAFSALDSDAPLLLVGTGLTMVDTVVSLLDAGHTGPIHAVSRHGRLPRPHGTSPAAPIELPSPLPDRLAPLMRCMRREIARALDAGADWRPVIDALRPFTPDIWRRLSVPERGRFLRHLRALWDVHRHRMPPQAADRIAAAQASKQLCVYAGRVIGLGAENGVATVTFRQRGTGVLRALKAARVVDCTGPGADVTQSTAPLVQALLRTGMARPDPLHLGFDVTMEGALLTRCGTPSRRLFAVGPLTKGAAWEITAVPDLRMQCHDLARVLGEGLTDIGKSNGYGCDRAAPALGNVASQNSLRGEIELGDVAQSGAN
jgi:uncharacterized NAD(P)/FAD-binding protein YdhS